MKKIILLLSFFIFSVNVQAQTPEELIKETTELVLADIKVNVEAYKTAPDLLYKFVDTTVLKYFDFAKMTNLAMGRYRRKMNDEQKLDMQDVFQELLVRTYSKALLEYTNQGVAYLPSKGSVKKGKVTVRTQIEQPGGQPIPLNYKLYLKDGNWMVYDIAVDNVSLVTNYRSSFSRKIKKSGIDGLIESLKERNSKS